MAKKQEDPSLEIFANLRTILVFVIIGSSIAGYVEYHSQASATKTQKRWRTAIDDKARSDSFLTLKEFESMIYGYPKISKSPSAVIVSREVLEDPESVEKDSGSKEEDSKPEETDEQKAQKERISKISKATSKYVDYTWDGLFSTSYVRVQLSNNEEKEETYVYRISDILH